jgi:hypothetical protein
MVDVDVFGGHPGAAQRIDLMVGVLICPGNPCVADQHVSTKLPVEIFRHSFLTRVLDITYLGKSAVQSRVG